MSLKTLEIGIDCEPGSIRPEAYISSVVKPLNIKEIPETSSRFFGAWIWHFKVDEDKYEEVKEEIRNIIRGLNSSGMIRGAQWGILEDDDD
jgi:hypothetical protein